MYFLFFYTMLLSFHCIHDILHCMKRSRNNFSVFFGCPYISFVMQHLQSLLNREDMKK